MGEQRILGFDFLRGICAAFVALYHTMLWQDSHDLVNIGLNSVCIFFILSGASITVAYSDKLRDGFPITHFLIRRFFRLAPLYWLATFALVLFHPAASLDQVALILLNLTFLFGFANPGDTAIPTGGWSLGIEFVFYALFPLIVITMQGKVRPYLFCMIALVLQSLFIYHNVQEANAIQTHWIRFAQFTSFIGYFYAGCLIGRQFLQHPGYRLHPVMSWVIFAALLLFLCIYPNQTQEDVFTGASGFMFLAASVAIVWVSGHLVIPRGFTATVAEMGTMSYGLYLLHPLVYGAARRIFTEPHGVNPWLVSLLIIAVSIVLALLVEWAWERPIKRFGYDKYTRGKTQAKLNFPFLHFWSFLNAFGNRHDVGLRFIQAMMLYLSTVYLFNNRLLVGFVLFCMVFFPIRFERKDWAFYILALFVGLNTAYGVLTHQIALESWTQNNGVVGGLLLIACYLAAKTLNERALVYLLMFILIEACAVIVQYYLGIRIFFDDQIKTLSAETAQGVRTLYRCYHELGYLQPFGFSNNASVTATKMLIGAIICGCIRMPQMMRIAVMCLLLCTLGIIYIRSALIGGLFFMAIYLLNEIFHRRWKLKHSIRLGGFTIIGLLFVFMSPTLCNSPFKKPIIPPVTAKIMPQVPEKNIIDSALTRLEESSRIKVWEAAAVQFKESPLLGHFSIRTEIIPLYLAHSSYVGMLVMHGLIGTLLMGLFWIRRLIEYPVRWMLVLPLLITSLTSDTLFWYLSFQDIFALYLLAGFREKLFPLKEETSA